MATLTRHMLNQQEHLVALQRSQQGLARGQTGLATQVSGMGERLSREIASALLAARGGVSTATLARYPAG